MQEKLLTIDEAAKLLNISRSTLYLLIRKESLPTVHFGSTVRVNPASLSDWLENREKRQKK
jgi:excisionase family DNA binding protein